MLIARHKLTQKPQKPNRPLKYPWKISIGLLEDPLKGPQKTLGRHLKDSLKTTGRPLEDPLKGPQKTLGRHLKDSLRSTGRP